MKEIAAESFRRLPPEYFLVVTSAYISNPIFRIAQSVTFRT